MLCTVSRQTALCHIRTVCFTLLTAFQPSLIYVSNSKQHTDLQNIVSKDNLTRSTSPQKTSAKQCSRSKAKTVTAIDDKYLGEAVGMDHQAC